MVGRPRLIWAVVVALALAASACSVLEDSDVFAEVQGSSSVPTVDPSGADQNAISGSGSGVSPYVCRDWESSRTYALKTNLVDIADVVSMPFPVQNENGDWVSEPFGISRVSDLVDELTSVESFCDIGLSPGAAEAIKAYQAEPDLVIARQILYDAIDEEVAPFGMAVGESSAVEQPITPRTASSDAMNMAGAASMRGDVEGSVALTELAVGLFEAESRKRLENNPSAQDLMEIAAGAQLLDLSKLNADALEKLREQVKQELIDAWKDAKKCAEVDSNQIKQMTEALAKADLVAVPDGPPSKANKDGFRLLDYHKWLNDWLQRQEDSANGKRYEDCPGNIFRAERDWPVGSGGLEVYLSTCDYKNWTGEMSANIIIPMDDGTVILEIFFPLKFGPMEDRRGAKVEADLEGRMVMSFKSPDSSAKVTNVEAFKARAEFSINGLEDANGGNLRIEFKPTVLEATVTVDGGGATMNFPISWGNVDLSGEFAPGDGSCEKSNAG